MKTTNQLTESQRAGPFDRERFYLAGDTALFHGVTYRCLFPLRGVAPDEDAKVWERVATPGPVPTWVPGGHYRRGDRVRLRAYYDFAGTSSIWERVLDNVPAGVGCRPDGGDVWRDKDTGRTLPVWRLVPGMGMEPKPSLSMGELV